jgi:HEPN superfamily AbiU2-like protein
LTANLTASADRMRLLIEEIYSDDITLRQEWTLFHQLYGNKQHVEVMRSTALVTFGLLQQVLREAIFMGIAHLLDGRIVAGHHTASLAQLIGSIPAENDDLVEQLDSDRQRLLSLCDPIIEWRHKAIAHASLAVATMEIVLEGVSVQSVPEALAGIESIHRQVCDRFYPEELWAYVGQTVDGDDLMHLLALASKRGQSQSHRIHQAPPPLPELADLFPLTVASDPRHAPRAIRRLALRGSSRPALGCPPTISLLS